MGFIIGIILLLILLVVIWQFKHMLDWSDRSLNGHEQPFDLGETREFSYRAVAKRPRVLDPLDISVRVRCIEVVYYNSGTDRQRRAEDFYVGEITFDRYPDDTAVVISGMVHIPADLPPSMDLPDNNIEWKLDFKLDPVNGVQLTESFDLKVVPRVRPPGAEPTYVQQPHWDDGTELIPPTPGDQYE